MRVFLDEASLIPGDGLDDRLTHAILGVEPQSLRGHERRRLRLRAVAVTVP
jgi:hypothetical protein